MKDSSAQVWSKNLRDYGLSIWIYMHWKPRCPIYFRIHETISCMTLGRGENIMTDINFLAVELSELENHRNVTSFNQKFLY